MISTDTYKTEKVRRIDIIDALKGYSIFTIMIFHYLEFLNLPFPINKVIFFGGSGVHMFVLLSGLGLYYSHLNKPLSYAVFFRKRFFKIYIPYVFVVLISAIISTIVPIYYNSMYALGGHIFLYKMFDESIMRSYGYQLWFISMILQIYFVFYIIIWLKVRLKNKWFFLSGLIISFIWSLLVYATDNENERVWNSFFLQYYWEFALGMIIGEKLSKNQKIVNKEINNGFLFMIGLINCLLYALLALKGGAIGRLFNDYFALIGYSLLAIWLFNLNVRPLNRFFLYIGSISLPIYLLHILLLFTVSKLIDIRPELQIFLCLVLIFPLSALYQKGINRFFKIAKI